MSLLEAPQQEQTNETDENHFAHVVTPASLVTEAYITGRPVTAICGKSFYATRDPEKLPICPVCKEILDVARKYRYDGV